MLPFTLQLAWMPSFTMLLVWTLPFTRLLGTLPSVLLLAWVLPFILLLTWMMHFILLLRWKQPFLLLLDVDDAHYIAVSRNANVIPLIVGARQQCFFPHISLTCLLPHPCPSCLADLAHVMSFGNEAGLSRSGRLFTTLEVSRLGAEGLSRGKGC